MEGRQKFGLVSGMVRKTHLRISWIEWDLKHE